MLPVWITDSVTPDLSRAIHYTLLWGLEGVVLRAVGKSGNRVPFVNEQQLRARLVEAELPIVAIDPGLFECSVRDKAAWMNDLLLLSEAASFCNRVGCKTIITGALAEDDKEFDISAAAEVFSRAGETVSQYGIELAVRNNASSDCASGETLAELVATVGNSYVLAAWSPADALEAGHDVVSGLDAILNHASLSFVFVRDGIAEASGWTDQSPGEGLVGWPAQFQRLAEAGFAGPVCLDVRGESPAKKGLVQATALIQQIKTARPHAR